ncbi:uncharacterized protein LOC124479116 isoform X2 [Hypomesus transpacificus]|uniref:uncharacterized protein LOC124479116 isoform X2 n=1 Tax=Hypomesus transpacificus TaxID=137520 RepID=UPI001F07B9E8|nr:uncharacterized protein LOC124479116 isoform X2 [Hypomesus transpacificus]
MHIVNVVPLTGHLRWKTLCQVGTDQGRSTSIALFHVDVFQSYLELKMSAPGLSRLAFTTMLDKKNSRFGRVSTVCGTNSGYIHHCLSGKISGDTFHQSVMEWAICRYEVDKICQEQLFVCPPCTPEMLAVAVELQKKMEEMSASIRQRTHRLYRQNDTNKGRHRMRDKIREEKGKLAALVLEHNTLVQPSERVEAVELIFQPEYIFPWHVPTSDTDILTKKKVFEKVMGIRRLEEEEVVLVKEMKQHWEYLKRRLEVLEQSISGDCWNLSPKGRKGLQSLRQRKLTEMKSHQAVVRQTYLQHLHLDLTEPDLDLEELLEEGQECLSSDTSSDDDDDVNT